MVDKVFSQLEQSKDSWRDIPLSVKCITTLPSFLMWFGAMIWVDNLFVWILMAVLSGIPTTALYQIYANVNINILDKRPSIIGHLVFFLLQALLIWGVIYAAKTP